MIIEIYMIRTFDNVVKLVSSPKFLMCHRYAIIFALDRIKWLEFLVLSLRICALTALGAGKLGFSFVRITALLESLSKRRFRQHGRKPEVIQQPAYYWA